VTPTFFDEHTTRRGILELEVRADRRDERGSKDSDGSAHVAFVLGARRCVVRV
jgi:hypothetical protein